MSYILNALRKSSEERKKLQELRSNPLRPLASTGQTGRRKRRRRLVGSIYTAAAVVFAAGLAVYFLTDSPQTAEILVPSTQEETAAATGQIAAEQPARPPDSPQAEAVSTPAASTATVGLSAQNPDNTSESTAPSESPQPAAAKNIPLLGDLPLATRALIPEMKFSGHVYSGTPSRRMIMINTTIAREGDMITPDIRLEEITDSGLILKYQTTLFQVELF